MVFVGEPGQCNDETLFEQYLGSVAEGAPSVRGTIRRLK